MTLAPIEPECHLVQVSREMLGADAMPRSNDSALEQREGGFDGVGCDHEAIFVPNVHFGFVINRLPFEYLGLGKPRIVEHGFVGHDHVHIFADVLLHDISDRLRRSLCHMDELQFAIALDDSDHDFFLPSAVSSAFVSLLDAEVGFIDFDGAVQHLVDFGHGKAYTMAEVPCGFVADAERALDLIRAHAFLGFTEQQGCEKPLLQGKMAVVEHGARGHAELIIAALAVEQLLGRRQFDGRHFAADALDTVGPAEPDQQLPAALVSVEKVHNVD